MQFSSDKDRVSTLLRAAALGAARRRAAEEWGALARRCRGAELLERAGRSECQAIREISESAAELVDQILRFHADGYAMLAAGEERYPEALVQIHSPPPLLFLKGQVPATWPTCVAVVGSRSATTAGCAFAREIAADLCGAGACVVSGFAAGIDAAAHRGALDHACADAPPTVAVMGCGLDTIYPAMHEKLACETVSAGGLLLSQFEPGVPPYPSNFLDRNRTIAGLSHAVIVVEAARRSGALATARRALEENREVFAVPGPPKSKLHEGCHTLIKDGARLCTVVSDVIEQVPALAATRPECGNSAAVDDEICKLLPPGREVAFEALASRYQGSDLRLRLLKLELCGRVRMLPGDVVLKC